MAADYYLLDLLAEPEFTYKEARTAREHLIICPLARDVMGRFLVTIESFLARPVANGCYEFGFAIVVYDILTKTVREKIFTSEKARPFVPQDRRNDVVEVVCESAKGLMGRVRPNCVIRVLAEPGKNSLRTHERITGAITSCGYDVQEHPNLAYSFLHRRLR